MKVSPIYGYTLQELRNKTRRIVHQGGQYSGKTVNILGALATLCSEEVPDFVKDNGITTVTSMSFPHLKGGALRDFESFVYPHFKGAIRSYHKTDHIFTFVSGSKLEFKVYENEMTARGQKRKRLFINEANSFPYMIYWQLDSRSDQTLIDYNPTIRFWAHENLIGFDGTKTYISDHRHNPFLDDSKHAQIENEKDKELFKVYARGLTGNVTGIIFPNWQMIDDEEYPFDEESTYSIDFGYNNDPSAIMKTCRKGNVLYVKELAYETAIPARTVKKILKRDGYRLEKDILYCEHDREMIRELRNEGIVNAFPAIKGPGSVDAGIKMLKRMDVKYTASSQNLHRERGKYIWIRDEKSGRLTNTPIDDNNHTFDAIRYGVYTKYLKKAV